MSGQPEDAVPKALVTRTVSQYYFWFRGEAADAPIVINVFELEDGTGLPRDHVTWETNSDDTPTVMHIQYANGDQQDIYLAHLCIMRKCVRKLKVDPEKQKKGDQ